MKTAFADENLVARCSRATFADAFSHADGSEVEERRVERLAGDEIERGSAQSFFSSNVLGGGLFDGSVLHLDVLVISCGKCADGSD